MNSIRTAAAPREGEVKDIMTSKPPKVNEQVEFILGQRAVAIGIVIETKDHSYKALVVMSEGDR